MIETSDIEDIGDVGRFAQTNWYAWTRQDDGTVTRAAFITATSGPAILVRLYDLDGSYIDDIITLDKFLKLEQGYYKSRFVEYNGSIVYVRNTGANEGTRNHGFNTSAYELAHVHPLLTHSLSEQLAYIVAITALSKKRTAFSDALSILDRGEAVGCALSDNYGLITTDKSDAIQIVRRSRTIGEIRYGMPSVYPQYKQYTFTVTKLCRRS